MIASKALTIKKFAYWTGITLIAIRFLTVGFSQINTNQLQFDQYLSFGYPVQFIFGLGCFNIIGVFILLMPPNVNWFKKWAFAGFVMEEILAVGDLYLNNQIKLCIISVVTLIVIIITYIIFKKINKLDKITSSFQDNSN